MTLCKDRLCHGRQFLRRKPAARLGGQSLLVPDRIGQQSRPGIRGRAGDDPVIVLGETLSFQERFPAAVRAAAKIGMRGGFRIIGFDDRLGRGRRFVDGPPTKVHDLFGMPQRPSCVERAAGMACVGSRHGIAGLQRPFHRTVDQRAGEAAVADALVFAVPRRCGRQPDLERDVRVLGGFDRPFHTAERRLHRYRRRRIFSHDAERRSDSRRRGNRNAAEDLTCQALATRRRRAAGAIRKRRECSDRTDRRQKRASFRSLKLYRVHGPLLIASTAVAEARRSLASHPRNSSRHFPFGMMVFLKFCAGGLILSI